MAKRIQMCPWLTLESYKGSKKKKKGFPIVEGKGVSAADSTRAR